MADKWLNKDGTDPAAQYPPDWQARAERAESRAIEMMAQIGALVNRAEQAEAQLATALDREEHLIAAARNPHQHEYGVCQKCGGVGSFMYGNTSTWREGCGGSAMTTGVCNKCWGSGSEERPWKSWRVIEAEWRNVDRLSQENETLRAQLASLAESGTGYSQQTVDAIVKERDALRARVTGLENSRYDGGDEHM